jgi:hypothetical protein
MHPSPYMSISRGSSCRRSLPLVLQVGVVSLKYGTPYLRTHAKYTHIIYNTVNE